MSRPTPVAALGALCLAVVPCLALANIAGAPGYSGASGASCDTCHAGGVSQPTVALTGPTTLAQGASATYTFTITGGPAVKGGMTVSASVPGTVLTPASGLRSVNDGRELTHSSPGTFVANALKYEFTVRAPPRGGVLKLSASGNSTNGDGTNGGDAPARTELDIQVEGGSDPEVGGCAATGVSLLPLALGAVALWLRRRS